MIRSLISLLSILLIIIISFIVFWSNIKNLINDTETLNSFINGVFGSIIASSIFLPIVFLFLKPKIDISPYIIETNKDPRFQNKTVFYFKIVNNSLFFKAFDIKLNLWSVTETVTNGENDISIKDIKLYRDNLFFMQSLLKGNQIVDKNALCACIFTTEEDILPLMERDDNYLQIQVIAKHGLSGLTGVFTKKYYKPLDCIKNGRFKHGVFTSTK